jgi:hypothetical protein
MQLVLASTGVGRQFGDDARQKVAAVQHQVRQRFAFLPAEASLYGYQDQVQESEKQGSAYRVTIGQEGLRNKPKGIRYVNRSENIAQTARTRSLIEFSQ